MVAPAKSPSHRRNIGRNATGLQVRTSWDAPAGGQTRRVAVLHVSLDRYTSARSHSEPTLGDNNASSTRTLPKVVNSTHVGPKQKEAPRRIHTDAHVDVSRATVHCSGHASCTRTHGRANVTSVRASSKGLSRRNHAESRSVPVACGATCQSPVSVNNAARKRSNMGAWVGVCTSGRDNLVFIGMMSVGHSSSSSNNVGEATVEEARQEPHGV
jgi:hypothetical protein